MRRSRRFSSYALRKSLIIWVRLTKLTDSPCRIASTPSATARWLLPLSQFFHNGKTHLAIGLGVEALNQGYSVSFVTMDQLLHLLKTQEISRNAQLRVKRIVRSDLVILDDLMFMALDRQEAHLFF